MPYDERQKCSNSDECNEDDRANNDHQSRFNPFDENQRLNKNMWKERWRVFMSIKLHIEIYIQLQNVEYNKTSFDMHNFPWKMVSNFCSVW